MTLSSLEWHELLAGLAGLQLGSTLWVVYSLRRLERAIRRVDR